jgi:hypothetical protein
MTIFHPNLSNITELQLESIPAGTTTLDLSFCAGLTELPDNLPAGITTLYLSFCRGLTKLPDNLPAGITTLDLSYCAGLTKLPDNLPAGITTLDLSYCAGLTKLPDNLPAGITTLNLSFCTGLTELPDNLPAGITTLDLSFCGRLTKLPDNLPAGITTLNLCGCEGLTKLPDNLPAGITTLDLSCCTGLTELPDNLPAGITTLNLRGCTGLTKLPDNLPAGITTLDLDGCESLPNTPALVGQLVALEERTFRLSWPVHLDHSSGEKQVKLVLKNAYKEFYKSDPNFKNKEPSAADEANYPVFALFHRFLKERVAERGGIKKITDSALKTAQQIAAKCTILEFLNESAKDYLEACVNQPVAGFTEIAVLAEAASQEGIEEKLGVMKVMMAVDAIREGIKELKNSEGETVGMEVEMELANAMLKKVQDKLLENETISAPWPGVPDGVAHEKTITSFLTGGNVASLCKKVSEEVLAKDLESVANTVCGGRFQDLWAIMVLTKEWRDELSEPLGKLKSEYLEKNGAEYEKAQLLLSIQEKKHELRQQILNRSKEVTLEAISSTEVSPEVAAANAEPLTKQQQNVMPLPH